MKRVRVVPKERVGAMGRGERFRIRAKPEADSLAQESVDFIVQTRFKEPKLQSSVRSRMSSSSSSVSSSSDQSSRFFKFRKPGRTNPAGNRDNSRIVNRTNRDLITDSGKNRSSNGRRIRFSGGRVDEVVKAPPNMKSGLVVIKSYCRYKPKIVPCLNSVIFYYYDVSSASCAPFRGFCSNSNNKFSSRESCLQTCIVRDTN